MDAISQESISIYWSVTWMLGMPLDPRPPNKIWKKKPNNRQSGKKKQITVIGCGNAIGKSIPLMVIFEEKYLSYEW